MEERWPMSAKIMVVEDDPIPAATVKLMLEQQGYRVVQAPDAETALDLLAVRVPDLLVLDLILPGIDGLELLSRIRRDPRTYELRVVLTTGGGEGLRRAPAAAAARTPRTWFVEKGAPSSDLLNAVAFALQTPTG